MIQFKYTPETWDTPLGPLSDPSPIQEMTMTLSGECITWEEATREFHNFLRAAGYVIPYDIEWYEDGKDVDDDADPLQKLTDWEEKHRPDECKVDVAKYGGVYLSAKEINELREALEEAVYLLNPTDEDMQKKAGVYRVVTALENLKKLKGKDA